MPACEGGNVFDVIEAVFDGGRLVIAAEESTEQIQADDAIAIGDRQNLIVSKVPVVRPGDGGGIGVCGTHRAGGSGEQVVEGGGREVRDVVAHAVFLESVDQAFQTFPGELTGYCWTGYR